MLLHLAVSAFTERNNIHRYSEQLSRVDLSLLLDVSHDHSMYFYDVDRPELYTHTVTQTLIQLFYQSLRQLYYPGY